MPRNARQKSLSGYYHVMLRGAGRQILFNDDNDRHVFLGLLRKELKTSGAKLIAWCLMDNHVHLLLCIDADKLSEFMHHLATCYAVRFNDKTGHVGPVFQGRFLSKAIESDEYLLQAVRYIHDNPLELGVTRDQHPWSSYREYVGNSNMTATRLVLDMVGGPAGFARYSEGGPSHSYAFGPRRRISATEMAEKTKAVLGDADPADIKTLPALRRNELLQRLRAVGLSIRQIERVTGIGRHVIEKVTAA